MSQLEKDILSTIQVTLGKSISEALNRYDSPFVNLVNKVVEDHESELRRIFSTSFKDVISTDEFQESVRNAFKHKVAKILVSKLEGQIEKSVTALRADPTLRSKMILAIENIIEENQPSEK